MSKDQKKTKKKNVENVDNSDLIKRLKNELNELEIKKNKLKYFLGRSEKSDEISDLHYSLLTMQYWSMCGYADALYTRILDLKGKLK